MYIFAYTFVQLGRWLYTYIDIKLFVQNSKSHNKCIYQFGKVLEKVEVLLRTYVPTTRVTTR